LLGDEVIPSEEADSARWRSSVSGFND